MSFVTDLLAHVRDERPEWQAELLEDGTILRIQEAAESPQEGRPVFHLVEVDDGVVLDGLWRMPVDGEKAVKARDLILDYVADGIENHGWEVPVRLRGGPRSGVTLSKHREDLAGRLLLARKVPGPDGEVARAEVYKWRLKRNDAGEYVCDHERTLEGDEVDAFLRRGVDSTGPFVLVHDRVRRG